MEDYFRRCFFVRTFADGNEKRVLRKLKNEFSIFKSPERDLTIGDVAHAQQNENKLSFAFAYSQHCHLEIRKVGVHLYIHCLLKV